MSGIDFYYIEIPKNKCTYALKNENNIANLFWEFKKLEICVCVFFFLIF